VVWSWKVGSNEDVKGCATRKKRQQKENDTAGNQRRADTNLFDYFCTTMLRLRSRATSSTNQASERRLGGGSISAATGKHSRSLSRDGAKGFIKRCIIITLPIKCVFYCYYYFVIVKKTPGVSFTSFLRIMVLPSSLFMSIVVVPSCPTTPWKTHEDIRGKCDSTSTTTSNTAKSIDECATSCCNDDNCITWQYDVT
jgi:hypothetical protein